MRLTGLEPALRKKLDPKSSASTNSATGAKADAKVILFIELTKLLSKNIKVSEVGNSLAHFCCYHDGDLNERLSFCCV